MKPIDALVEEVIDDDEMAALYDDKAPREIGGYIQHDQFNQVEDEEEDPKAQYKDLTDVQKTFVMDHDFVCIHN